MELPSGECMVRRRKHRKGASEQFSRVFSEALSGGGAVDRPVPRTRDEGGAIGDRFVRSCEGARVRGAVRPPARTIERRAGRSADQHSGAANLSSRQGKWARRGHRDGERGVSLCRPKCHRRFGGSGTSAGELREAATAAAAGGGTIDVPPESQRAREGAKRRRHFPRGGSAHRAGGNRELRRDADLRRKGGKARVELGND